MLDQPPLLLLHLLAEKKPGDQLISTASSALANER